MMNYGNFLMVFVCPKIYNRPSRPAFFKARSLSLHYEYILSTSIKVAAILAARVWQASHCLAGLLRNPLKQVLSVFNFPQHRQITQTDSLDP